MIHIICDGCGSPYPEFYFDSLPTCRLCCAQGRLGGGEEVRARSIRIQYYEPPPEVRINPFEVSDYGAIMSRVVHGKRPKFRAAWEAR